jgi:hypothetical protein
MKPRELDYSKAYDELVQWTAQATREAPGLVLGVSGTDSGLAYRICTDAWKVAGKDPAAVVGIHYGTTHRKWDWFKQYGTFAIRRPSKKNHIEEDVYRWAGLQTYAVKNRHWLVGTRNKTEQLTGDYSNASQVAVIQPIVALWKSEVFELCKRISMPQEIIDSGWMGDPFCTCHRPGLLGRLEDCETALAYRAGERALFVHEMKAYEEAAAFLDMNFLPGKEFKSKIPYIPGVLSKCL